MTPMPPRPTALAHCIAAAAACLLLLAAPLRAATAPEYELKLALMYNIARFVTWPQQREQLGELSFCVVGTDPFGTAIDGIRGRKVRDRKISVVMIDGPLGAKERCDILFVAKSAAARAQSVIQHTAGTPVLTISDASGFAAAGGIVELQTRDGRVGFVINQPAYQSAQLTVSSQLLQLATSVTGTRRTAK